MMISPRPGDIKRKGGSSHPPKPSKDANAGKIFENLFFLQIDIRLYDENLTASF